MFTQKYCLTCFFYPNSEHVKIHMLIYISEKLRNRPKELKHFNADVNYAQNALKGFYF